MHSRQFERCDWRSFESWVGQASKIAFAGYVTERAGGPKEAYFDKPSQEKLHDMQMVRKSCCRGCWDHLRSV